MRVVVAIVAVTVITALIVGTYLPIKKDAAPMVCLDCGIQRQDRFVLGILRSTFPTTEFSAWYDQRIGLPHTHRWKEDLSTCAFGENLWGTRWALGSGSGGSPIQVDYSVLASVMRRLEPLDLDRTLWKELTNPDPVRAREVVHAAWNLFHAPDDQIRDWWKYTQLYLERPDAWKDGFEKFAIASGWDRMSWVRVYESSSP